jgi:hypothetical protein
VNNLIKKEYVHPLDAYAGSLNLHLKKGKNLIKIVMPREPHEGTHLAKNGLKLAE